MKGNLKRNRVTNLAFIDLPLPGDDLEASVTTEEPGSAGTTRDASAEIEPSPSRRPIP